jgi:predicted MFS family arabinose efflux permease
LFGFTHTNGENLLPVILIVVHGLQTIKTSHRRNHHHPDHHPSAANMTARDMMEDHHETPAPRSASTSSMGSLLAQALDVPSLDHAGQEGTTTSSFERYQEDEPVESTFATSPPLQMGTYVTDNRSSHIYRNSRLSPTLPTPDEHEHPMLPVHSDFTIPTSNARCNRIQAGLAAAPDLDLTPSPGNRRSVFPKPVGKRYVVKPPSMGVSGGASSSFSSSVDASITPPQSPKPSYTIGPPTISTISPLTPAHPIIGRGTSLDEDDELPRPKRLHQLHETVHAQSLLLGLAFMAVWSPNNAMAPNLTQMAESFGMTEQERDLYLGSYCALAVGVFSLPITALLGFMTDFYPRKQLFMACVVGGSLASAWTGWSTNFTSLFLARLWNGGCMSASVPVAFSLLGDLFSTEERNAASSGLTAMMGLGIIAGQVYAGTVGPTAGWQHPFFVSSLLALTTALLVLLWVREPVRGAKEKVLQDLLKSGNKYDRKLTFDGFLHAMRHNRSNMILLWQGFFTSLPWGIVFVFLNDYLSQEKRFSVPDATFMVMLFGIGCAIGGICGGYIGQMCMRFNRSYLPLFMAVSTFMGIFPFLGLLNSSFTNHHGYKAMGYSILGGCLASLPSVNVRPCIINVNPPETRGAALTAANLLIALGRGIGPSCITIMGSSFNWSRQVSFNVTLTGFWTVTAIQLLFLAKTFPKDQDTMEAELARYAAEGAQQRRLLLEKNGGTDNNNNEEPGIETILMSPGSAHNSLLEDEGESLVSIEEYMTSFDGLAARRSIQFMRQGIREIKDEMSCLGHACRSTNEDSDEDGSGSDEIMSQDEIQKRRVLWRQQQHRLSQSDLPATEETALLAV